MEDIRIMMFLDFCFQLLFCEELQELSVAECLYGIIPQILFFSGFFIGSFSFISLVVDNPIFHMIHHDVCIRILEASEFELLFLPCFFIAYLLYEPSCIRKSDTRRSSVIVDKTIEKWLWVSFCYEVDAFESILRTLRHRKDIFETDIFLYSSHRVHDIDGIIRPVYRVNLPRFMIGGIFLLEDGLKVCPDRESVFLAIRIIGIEM